MRASLASTLYHAYGYFVGLLQQVPLGMKSNFAQATPTSLRPLRSQLRVSMILLTPTPPLLVSPMIKQQYVAISLSTVMPPFESALSCCCTESVIPFAVLDDSTYVFDPYSSIDLTCMWAQLCASNPDIITAAPQPTSGVNGIADSNSSTPCESNDQATICGDVT